MNANNQAEEMALGCARAVEAAGYVLGQMSAAERAAFAEHAAGCRECAEAVNAARAVFGQLRALPPAVAAPDVTQRVLARVYGRRRPRWVWRSWPAWARHAAAVLLAAAALGAAALGARRLRPTAPRAAGNVSFPALAQAQAWLRQAQPRDGIWRAARGGTAERYDIGVTGLALLALLEGAQDPLAGPNGAAIRRGIAGLLAQQAPNGLFGPVFAGAPYNHGLATLALVNACAAAGEPAWRAAAERALAFLAAAQDARGGWGYLGGGAEAVNSGISVWPLLALLRARELGWPGVDIPIARGLSWLQASANPDGLLGYRRPNEFPYGPNTLTAAGAVCLLRGGGRHSDPRLLNLMLPLVRRAANDAALAPDFYRSFFVAEALALAREDAASRYALDALKARLLASQVRAGAAAGSWPPEDAWGAIGGPVYATALASLSLRRF